MGHTLGLRHCAAPKCMMHFSNSLEDPDNESMTFCLICHDRTVES
ncbi:hypothetical protein [Nitrosomonas sp. Nm34]